MRDVRRSVYDVRHDSRNVYDVRREVGILLRGNVVGVLVRVLLVLGASAVLNGCSQPVTTQANIIFVMTDDQPKDTMMAMPEVTGRVGNMGMTLSNAYVSESLCCPSRASVLRGQYPHNTGVLRNDPPNGGAKTFRASGKENSKNSTVATMLRR
jgi:hypothetical protein